MSYVKVIFDKSIKRGSFEMQVINIELGFDKDLLPCTNVYRFSKDSFKNRIGCDHFSTDYALAKFKKKLDKYNIGLDVSWIFWDGLCVEITIKKKKENNKMEEYGISAADYWANDVIATEEWHQDFVATAIPKKFNVYIGLERATNKVKTIVKWSDGHTETVYNCKKASNLLIAVSYAHCKRRFGTNSAYKKYIDRHTKPLMPGYVMFDDGDSQATARSTASAVHDIYDMAALSIATKCYGLDKMNEMIGGNK